MKNEHAPQLDIAISPEIDGIEILELLGQGGMSLVYKARQLQLDRIVAVKIMSTLGSGTDILRFQKEAKLTTSLDHPNIVKTISFGVSKNKHQPYLVLEYLQGNSLAAEFKSNGRLSLNKFRFVFLEALSALEHAHKAGVIHRDIKPANIVLCKNENGLDTIKLVDFGIAKVFVGDESATAQNLTASSALLGTPIYMSPEQCQGKTLDFRSDLYSLACVMFESVTGEPPYSAESALALMQKHCLEPDMTVSNLTSKVGINKELAEAIVLGLRKDPAARPKSASEYAGILETALKDQPDVLPEIIQVSQKETRKNTSRLILLAFVFLIIGCLSIVWLNGRHLNHPLPNSSTAKSITNISIKNKSEANPPMDDTEKSIRSEFDKTKEKYGDGSERLLKYYDALAEHYEEKQEWEPAEKPRKRAIEIREKIHSPTHLDLAKNLSELAKDYSKQDNTKKMKAEKLLKRCLSIRQKELGRNHVLVADTLYQMSELFRHQRRSVEAEEYLKRSLKIREPLLNENSDVAFSLLRLAENYSQQDKFKQAEPILKRVLQIREREQGPESKEVAVALYRLAESLIGQQKGMQAEPLISRSLKIREKEFGPNSKEVAAILYLAGNNYYRMGKYAKAIPLLERALKIREVAVEPGSHDLERTEHQLKRCRVLLRKELRKEELAVKKR